MINKEKLVLGDIPVICCYDDSGGKRPVLIMSHGFKGSKESFERKGSIYSFAQAGFFVLSMDNRFHGEREGDDFKKVLMNEDEQLNIFETRKAIKATAEDMSALLDMVSDNQFADSENAAVLGVSMGGFAAYSAVVNDKRIKAAAPIIASPYWDDIPGDMPEITYKSTAEELMVYSKNYQPASYINQFYPTSILMQIGDNDAHYRPDRVRQFYNSLKTLYKDAPDNVRLKLYKWTEHNCTDEMMDSAYRWLSESMIK